ncbi:MAG: (Fe-S)-binding protein [Deinococcales bacterium]
MRIAKFVAVQQVVYNIEHPETASKLGQMKAKNVMATGADLLVSGNIGCLTQLKQHLKALNSPIKVMHTAELLSKAYEGNFSL